jgi:hypothetical protein
LARGVSSAATAGEAASPRAESAIASARFIVARDPQALADRRAVAAVEGLPAAARPVPRPDLLSVEGLIDEGDAPDAEVVHRLGLAPHLEAASVGLEGSAKVVLDLIGLDDAAVLLRIGDVGPVHECLQIRHPFAPLPEEEGNVEGDEFLEGLDHTQHQWRHLAADHGDVLDLLSQARRLFFLRGQQLRELSVVDPQGLDLLQLFAVLPGQLVGLVRDLVDAVLGRGAGLVGRYPDAHSLLQRLGPSEGRCGEPDGGARGQGRAAPPAPSGDGASNGFVSVLQDRPRVVGRQVPFGGSAPPIFSKTHRNFQLR